MKIRHQLRSVRASALLEEKRRQELRGAEARCEHGHGRDVPAASAASPRAAGNNGAPRPPEAGAGRAGVSKTE